MFTSEPLGAEVAITACTKRIAIVLFLAARTALVWSHRKSKRCRDLTPSRAAFQHPLSGAPRSHLKDDLTFYENLICEMSL